MNRFRFLLILSVVLVACAPTARSIRADVPLREYQNVGFIFNNTNVGEAISGGAISYGGAAGVGGSAMSVSGAAEQAAIQFAFELEFIGFRIVQDLSDADAIVDFSIGVVRFDPLAAWIADQAQARFYDPVTGLTIGAYRTGTAFITPTTESLVSRLATEVESDW